MAQPYFNYAVIENNLSKPQGMNMDFYIASANCSEATIIAANMMIVLNVMFKTTMIVFVQHVMRFSIKTSAVGTHNN
jgi:hypothetical protein